MNRCKNCNKLINLSEAIRNKGECDNCTTIDEETMLELLQMTAIQRQESEMYK